MTRMEFAYDFSYTAADPGRSWTAIVQEILNESAELAVQRLRAAAPVRSGELKAQHRAIPGNGRATIQNKATYAEFVKPNGSKGRWRWWMAKEFRNAFEDVSIAKYGDVEDALLVAIGPRVRDGGRADARRARVAARQAGTARIVVPTDTGTHSERMAFFSTMRADRTTNLARGPR